MPEDVLYAEQGGVALLTLDRPPLNLIGPGVLAGLGDAVNRAARDHDVSVIVVTGGEKIFSEGTDADAYSAMNFETRSSFVRSGQEALWRLEHVEKPTLAAIAGRVMGAGLELALACDMRVAADNAIFGHPEVSQGLTPLFGDTFRLERLVGKSRARSLIFIGEPVSAWEALEIGLVGKIAPNDMLLEEARIMARRIASQPLEALKATKRAMLAAGDEQARGALAAAFDSFLKLQGTRRRKARRRRSPNRE